MEKLILEEIQHQDNLLKLNTKLWLAIKNSDLQKSQELLQQGANLHLLTGVILRRYDLEENTPLHIAAKEGSLSLIKLFIEHNTPVDVRNRLKQTPLQWASYYGHLKIVEYLIAHNADIDAIDIDGDPSLTWAASKGEIKVVNYLITQGADPAKVSPLGNTALHWVSHQPRMRPYFKKCARLYSFGFSYRKCSCRYSKITRRIQKITYVYQHNQTASYSITTFIISITICNLLLILTTLFT